MYIQLEFGDGSAYKVDGQRGSSYVGKAGDSKGELTVNKTTLCNNSYLLLYICIIRNKKVRKIFVYS